MPKHPPAQEKQSVHPTKYYLSPASGWYISIRPVTAGKFHPPVNGRPGRKTIAMLYAYVTLQLALFLIGLGGYFQVSRFLRQHSAIMKASHMDAFKRMVKVNMYVALGYLVLGIPGILMSLYLAFTEGLTGIAVVVMMNIPIFLLGKQTKKLEMRSRELECLTALAPEYHAVGETWHKKALPNF
jgi:hypothetical protein